MIRRMLLVVLLLFTVFNAYSQVNGTVTQDGNYTVITFKQSGSFTLGSNKTLATLVVGGGGGGGLATSSRGGGGGGAGGYLYNASYLVANGTYTITVGGGGAVMTNGSDSVFSTMTAVGGGGGGGSSSTVAQIGGSGGGGGSSTPTHAHGIAGQGNDGGVGLYGTHDAGGGGGGCGGIGADASTASPGWGNRGIGCTNAINGTSMNYSTGGYGGDSQTAGTTITYSIEGTANTGDGGGGGGLNALTGAAGGSGIVIIRMLTIDVPTINSPNNVVQNSQTVNYNFTVNSLVGVNCNITRNGTTAASNIYSSGSGTPTIATNTSTDGYYIWNVTCWNGTAISTSLNGNYTVDATPTSVYLLTTQSYNATYVTYNFTGLVVAPNRAIADVNVSIYVNTSLSTTQMVNLTANQIYTLTASWIVARPITDMNFTASVNTTSVAYSGNMSDSALMILPMDPMTAINLMANGGKTTCRTPQDIGYWDDRNWSINSSWSCNYNNLNLQTQFPNSGINYFGDGTTTFSNSILQIKWFNRLAGDGGTNSIFIFNNGSNVTIKVNP